MKRRISQGQAMRSTFASSRVTHFIIAPSMCLRRPGRSCLSVECRADALRELLRRALSPEVREVEGRLLADHVIVEGDDVNPGFPESPEDRLHLGAGHDEVTVHGGELAPARERGPGRK